MSALTNLLQSTIGKKAAMAATGLIMAGWLFLHMAGNLLVFAGPEHFNRYAAMIQSGFNIEPALVWVMRIGLLAAIAVHIWAARGLTALNRAARPQAYAGGRKNRATSYAAEFMLFGGLVVLTFLIFHLAHLTVGAFSNDIVHHATFSRHNAYLNLVVGLNNPIVGAFYIVANLALAAHLHHGIASGMQTLGLNDDRWNPVKVSLSRWFPLVLLVGNVSVALACMFGKGTILVLPDPNWTPPSTH